MPNVRLASSRRLVRGAVAPLALALLAAGPTGAALAAPPRVPPAAPATQDVGWCADEEELAAMELINGYRASSGLAPLRFSPSLGAAADAHSNEMAANNYFDHTMLGGVSVAENLAGHGYTDPTYGENIAAGSASAGGTFGQWQGSATHNATMLGGAYEAVGIGRAFDPRSGYGWYWTAIFGGSADGQAAGCGAMTTVPEIAPAVDPPPTAPPEPTPPAEPEAAQGLLVPPPPPPATPTTDPLPLANLATGAQTTAELNLRAGPGADYEGLGTVPVGGRLEVAGPAEAGYLPVTSDGRFGWVVADYVTSDTVAAAATLPESAATPIAAAPLPADAALSGVPPTDVASPTDPAVPTATDPAAAATTTSDIGLRAGPSDAELVLVVIPVGAPVTLTGETSGRFLGAAYDGATGWVDAAYLSR